MRARELGDALYDALYAAVSVWTLLLLSLLLIASYILLLAPGIALRYIGERLIMLCRSIQDRLERIGGRFLE